MFTAIRVWWEGLMRPDTQPLWHPHHDKLLGVWYGGIKDRRKQILKHKPPEQQAIRLQLLKPVRGKLPFMAMQGAVTYNNWDMYLTKLEKQQVLDLHEKECYHNCPMQRWNGKDEICPTG